MARLGVTALDIIGICCLAVGFVLVLNAGRPLPFGSSGDAPVYFLPLIQAHTDAWLSGHFLAIDWRLGCGWTPWEGVLTGPFYPPYLAANLLARMIGSPLAILEVSAAIHLALAGVGVYIFTSGVLDRPRRVLWACLAMVQPAPVAIGMNWHNYLTCYPWFLALLLLLWRVSRTYSAWTLMNRLLLVLLFISFFLAAHPQMFVFGTALLFGWRLALGHGRALCRDWLVMGAALVPLVIPLLFIHQQSLLATPDWFAARGGKEFILLQAQSLPTWLVGLSVGNLIPSRLFSIWPGVSWTGIGIFFCPLLILSVGIAIRKRNWVWVLLTAGLGLLLSAQSFPMVAWFSVGPFAGFRWTWKLSIFTAALALAMTLVESVGWRFARRRHLWALAVLIGLSAAVCVRALPFDLFPAGTRNPGSSVATVCSETRSLMREWGIQPGERIARVGKRRIHMNAIAAPLHGLMGNAPLLVGLHSAHLYEPLENYEASLAHDGFSTPWRVTVGWGDYVARRADYDRRFSELGVTWLVSPFPGAFPEQERLTYRDATGEAVYGVRLPPLQEGVSFPWGETADGRKVALVVEPGGALRTASAMAEPPSVPVGRPLRWERLPSGHWRGTARLVDQSWFVAGALGAALSGVLLAGKRRWMDRE